MSDVLETAKRPPRVKEVTTRSGERRYYLHPRGGRYPLPTGVPYDDPKFLAAYRRAANQNGLPTARRAAVIRDNIYTEALDRALARAMGRSVEKGRSFSLVTEDLLKVLASQDYRCAITGLPFVIGADRAGPYSLSIDRIDSRKGYDPENVRIVIYAVNVAINEWGDDTFYTICAAAVSRRFGPKV